MGQGSYHDRTIESSTSFNSVPQMINPHSGYGTTFGTMMRSLWGHRELIARMTKREVIARYRGSVIGLAWSFLHPMLMLTVYTFVFSVVFKGRWGSFGEEDRAQFALVLFVGLIVHGVFTDVLNRAPGLIVSNGNFVKKVVFPLEILPVVTVGVTLFHCVANIGVLLTASLLFNGYLQWTVIFLPLVLLPLVILTLGMAWVMASIGVFLRDIGQAVGVLTMVMLFLSPVFYPTTALPESIQPWLMANPLSFIIEQARDVVIWGHVPNWIGLGGYTIVGGVTAWAGYWWFQNTRKGFADLV